MLGAAAVAGFAVFGAAARGAHPATHHAVSTSGGAGAGSVSSSSSFGFGSTSLGDPGRAVAQVQSAGS